MSSPTPLPGSRSLASNTLRKAGLMDKDAVMRDMTGDKPGGRKGSSKTRSHRAKAFDGMKVDKILGPSSANHLIARISSSGSADSPLSIRGAGRPSTTTLGRIRRNATVVTSGGPVLIQQPKSTVHAWRELVKKRWNPEQRFLNLSSLIDDDIVKTNNLLPPGYGGSGREAQVIFKLAAELKPEIQSLDLSNNNLTGTHLSSLGHYLPRLVNLSLQNNKIRFKDIDSFALSKRGKLLHLKELILIGNPIREQESQQGQSPKYRMEISRRFPSLSMLDQQPLTQIHFDVAPTTKGPVAKPSATTFPYEMGPSLIIGVNPELVSDFLTRFFSLYDTDRPSLAHVYHPESTFSYSVNTTIPTRAKLQGFQHTLPNQKKLTWESYLNADIDATERRTNHTVEAITRGSRNLSRLLGSLDKQQARLHIGGEGAVNGFGTLPGTKHDITGGPELFSLDCFPVAHGQQMGLMVIVHGQFEELPSCGLRSFDRTFIIIPAPEGSVARLNNWQVQIISDQLTVRPYSHHDAWKPGPMLVQAESGLALPQSSGGVGGGQQPLQVMQLPPDQQAALMQIPEPQRSLVVDICGRTKLNVQYAVDCLTSNNWDTQKAVANFHQVSATLPREAFLA